MNDNVRKIFDMLGVEPNEKFKVDGLGECYIDSNLDIYLNTGGIKLKSNLIIDIIKGKDTIIKLPKKKKLRDLTEEEYKKWIDKNCDWDKDCDGCIFKHVFCVTKDSIWIYHKDLYSDKFLDQEIEVEE